MESLRISFSDHSPGAIDKLVKRVFRPVEHVGRCPAPESPEPSSLALARRRPGAAAAANARELQLRAQGP
jgi:hypothetical protein